MAIQIDKMGDSSRKLAVMFECSRCKKVVTLPFKNVVKFRCKESAFENDVAELSNMTLPDGWQTHCFYKLFCPKCAEAYERFMLPPERTEDADDASYVCSAFEGRKDAY